MTAHPSTVRGRALRLVAVISALACGCAPGRADTPGADQARYEQDRADCMAVRAGEDRAACLKKAHATSARARQEPMIDGPGSHATQDRLRCNGLSGPDRARCLALVKGPVGGATGDEGGVRDPASRKPAAPDTAGGGSKVD